MNSYTVTLFTEFPLKSWGTQALKAAHVVHTRGSIRTRTLLTLVDICSKKERALSMCLSELREDVEKFFSLVQRSR